MALRHRRDRRDAARLALDELRWAMQLAREDLAVMGARLEETPLGSDLAASVAWKRAADRYAAARAGLRTVRTVKDVAAVQALLHQAWFQLARCDALALGCEPPSRADPCYFNPQHGPAVTDVSWSPPGGRPAPTPVCGVDAARIEAGLAPRYRVRHDLAVARTERTKGSTALLGLNAGVGWTGGAFQPSHRPWAGLRTTTAMR